VRTPSSVDQNGALLHSVSWALLTTRFIVVSTLLIIMLLNNVTTFDVDVYHENKISQDITCVTLSTFFQQGNILRRICDRTSFHSV